MMLVSDMLDIELLRQMIEAGMVRLNAYPAGRFHILGYTPAAQYSRTWNPVTLQCRGLITDGHPVLDLNATVVARPFGKFFNASEHDGELLPKLPTDAPFELFNKLDGSLGILWFDEHGEPRIATRGSFTSEQAIWATDHYRMNYGGYQIPRGYTLLFEIIYPQNRIVVDYGTREELVLLAAIDIETGDDVALPSDWPGPVVQKYTALDRIEDVIRTTEGSTYVNANSEGYVLRYLPQSSTPGPRLRVKVKHAEYLRLHKIITGVSKRTIWEYLSGGRSLDELIDRVPDEFMQWVKNQAADLQERYDAIESDCIGYFVSRPQDCDRREVAEYFQSHAHRAVLFRMLDERPYNDLIWRSILPAADKPFREDVNS